MRVFIVRHGQTDWNVEHRWQGHTDIPLNQVGRDQAQQIANRLRLEKIDHIFSSPLSRALDTAKAIATYHPNTKLTIEPSLREIGFGEAEGLLNQDFMEKYPNYAFVKKSPHERYIWKFSGGESIEERVEELIPKIEAWRKRFKNKTILLSAHGAIKRGILIAFKVATMADLIETFFDNTALTIIHPFGTDKIELLNDTSHLG